MSLIDTARRWAGAVVRTVFAPQCRLCGAPGDAALPLCSACAADLPWLGPACARCALPLTAGQVCARCLRRPPPQSATFAALVYAPPADRLLTEFKFGRHLAHARLLGGLAATGITARPGWRPPAALVPVPLHRRRLRQRGFDQALEISRQLGRRLDVPVWDGLDRVRLTTPQTALPAPARRRNVRGAFAVRTAPPPGLLGVVDDVMTTGATAQEAARTLLRGGAAEVVVIAVARTP